MNIKKVMAVFALVASPAIWADAGDLSVGAAVGYTFADSARKPDAGADDGMAYRVFMNKAMTDHLGLELGYMHTSFEVDTDGKKNRSGAYIDLTFELPAGEHYDIYALAGIGIARTDLPGGVDEQHAYQELGLGVSRAISNKWDMRLEARYAITKDDDSVAGEDEFSDVEVLLGLQYKLYHDTHRKRACAE